MQFPQNPHPHWAQNGRISTIRFHNLKYLEGNCMRNVSPADERRPQGLRAHIHTFTMRAFSDSSAKKFAHCGPSRSSSAKKLARHTPTNATPGRKLSRHTPTNATPGRKLSRYSKKHPIWALFRVQGECIHACGSNRPSRRIPLASSAAVEARHTDTDLYTPIMAAPLIGRKDQHTAAALCIHDPAIVVDTGDHRQDQIERKNAHA